MTRRDVFGLLRAVLSSAAMFIAGGIVPVVGALATMLAPVPLMLFAIGYPRAQLRVAIAIALAAGLIGAGAGLIAAGVFLVTAGLAAGIMSYMLARRYPFEVITACTAGALIVSGAVAAILAAGSASALSDSLRANLLLALDNGQKFYKSAGLDTVLQPDMRATIVDGTIKLFPALATMSAAVTVLMNLGLFWRLGGRQERVGYPLFGDLVRWSAPEWLIWALLATGFGLFIPMKVLSTIALNCFICLVAVYFCQGLAIMAFYFRVLAMPALARGLIYFVTSVQPVLAILVCAAGVLDLWIDFRRLRSPSQEARNLGDFL
ncbi:MAG TPA: DUF2232 domain-containing protein [Candidatus Binataceae bacterium]|nr:DUF2232 domain-containing protein [Candidatus Binataceae bacterium]